MSLDFDPVTGHTLEWLRVLRELEDGDEAKRKRQANSESEKSLEPSDEEN